MTTRNIVFIAKSLDGYIADKNGGLDWLQLVPNPEHNDMGYNKFMDQIDAIVMGRITFESVCNFDCDWPYHRPVFVMSTTMESVPAEYSDKAELVRGSLTEVLEKIHQKGFKQLYIDGGTTIQGFLKEDLIDELVITTIPVLLGGGSPLFSELPKQLEFKHIASEVFINEIVQNHYIRKR